VLPIHSVLKLKQLQESKLAATWCPECEDFLCTDCNRHHPRCSSTKQHIVISMENYQKLPSSILSIKNRCTTHGHRYEFYCTVHGTPCCVMCIRDNHRHCKELRPIHEITENAKSSQVAADLDSLSSTQMLQYCIVPMSTFLKTKHGT
jgi:hypothetical protein